MQLCENLWTNGRKHLSQSIPTIDPAERGLFGLAAKSPVSKCPPSPTGNYVRAVLQRGREAERRFQEEAATAHTGGWKGRCRDPPNAWPPYPGRVRDQHNPNAVKGRTQQ